MLGIGIVGTGWVSGEHVKAFENNPNTSVVAITGRTEEGASALMDGNSLDCELYTDYSKMLQQRDLDAVVICTPPVLHVPQALADAEDGDGEVDVDPGRPRCPEERPQVTECRHEYLLPVRRRVRPTPWDP